MTSKQATSENLNLISNSINNDDPLDAFNDQSSSSSTGEFCSSKKPYGRFCFFLF